MTSASAPKPTSRSPDWRLYVAVAHALLRAAFTLVYY